MRALSTLAAPRPDAPRIDREQELIDPADDHPPPAIGRPETCSCHRRGVAAGSGSDPQWAESRARLRWDRPTDALPPSDLVLQVGTASHMPNAQRTSPGGHAALGQRARASTTSRRVSPVISGMTTAGSRKSLVCRPRWLRARTSMPRPDVDDRARRVCIAPCRSVLISVAIA